MEERVGISAEYLLKGAWYAFEQSGRLIRDAVLLYDNGAYSSALALALFASEELGKGRVLLDLWSDVEQRGRAVEPMEVMAACADHDRKHMKAQLSAMLKVAGPGAVAQLVWARMRTEPRSHEFQEAEGELDQIMQTLANPALDERHAARQRALYVDPNVGHLLGVDEVGTGWKMPSGIPQGEARRGIEPAANDYASQYDRLRPEMLRAEDPALAAALEAWPNRPELPLPKWPELA